MSQISPPIRIVIVAAVALLGAWMLFLRPKTEPAVPPPAPAPATAPGVKGLSSAVDKANGAAATSDAANAKIQSATGEESAATAKPAGQAAAKGAGAAAGGRAKGLPARVQKAVDAKKVVVLYFYNPKSADDRFTKRQLADVDRWQGEVVLQAANVNSVSRYGKIARGADVEQSPTVVVVDRNRKAEKLVGVQDTRSIDQAVVDAMRNSGGLIKDRYLRAVNDVCRTTGASIWTVPSPTQLGSDVEAAVETYVHGSERLLARFKAVPAPARWRAFKKAGVADLRKLHASNLRFQKSVGNGKSPAAILRAAGTQDRELKGTGQAWNKRMDKHHVLSCGSNF